MTKLQALALSSAVAAALGLGTITVAQAAGFAITEQSVKGLGTAFSNAAAAGDASTVWFNPAGMTRLDTQMVAGGHLILPQADFTDAGTVLLTTAGPAPNRGTTATRDPAVGALVPNFYYVKKLNRRLWLGLGVNSPFGLKTDYDQTWVGRYQAISTTMFTANINPSFAFKLNDKFSFGAGFSAQYIHVRLTRAIDKSTICQGTLAKLAAAGSPTTAAFAAGCAAAGLTAASLATPATDGSLRLEGHDWSFGYNLGVLFEPTADTRFGLQFRSKITQNIDNGDAQFGNTADLAALLGGGTFTNQNFGTKLDLPETLSFNAYHRYNAKLAVMADITWTRWNRFNQLSAAFDGGQPNLSERRDWNNTVRLALGAEYAYTPRVTLRTGVAYDPTPVPNPVRRDPLIPDDNRIWLSFGTSYNYSKQLSVDFSYAHLFVGNANISNTDSLGHLLSGSFDNSVDIVSVQGMYRF